MTIGEKLYEYAQVTLLAKGFSPAIVLFLNFRGVQVNRDVLWSASAAATVHRLYLVACSVNVIEGEDRGFRQCRYCRWSSSMFYESPWGTAALAGGEGTGACSASSSASSRPVRVVLLVLVRVASLQRGVAGVIIPDAQETSCLFRFGQTWRRSRRIMRSVPVQAVVKRIKRFTAGFVVQHRIAIEHSWHFE